MRDDSPVHEAQSAGTPVIAALLAWYLSITSIFGPDAMADSPSTAVCTQSVEANRSLVLSFYEQGLTNKQPRSAFEKYVSLDFIEHKPDVPVGTRGAAIEFLEGLISSLPDAHWAVLRTVAEGNYVFVNARLTPATGALPYVIADLFRIENCTIVEHRDVVGPPREGQPNPNSRF